MMPNLRYRVSNETYNLLKNTYKVKKISRGNIRPQNNSFSVDYLAIADVKISDFDIILIEGNFLNDPHLDGFLAHHKFDAVICWLIGTQGNNIQENQRFKEYQISSLGDYRLHVQNKIYSESHKWLRSGGIANFVDRGQSLDNQILIDDMIDSHKDQSRDTHMNVNPDSFKRIEFDPSLIQGGMGYVFTPGTLGIIPENPRFNLTSISAEFTPQA
jgi:hypothetical protein